VQLPGPARDIYHMPWDHVVLDAMTAALAQVASAYGVRQAVSLVNFPRWQPLAMRSGEQFGWNIVYDCRDDQRAFADLFQTELRGHEDRLIDPSDLLSTSNAVDYRNSSHDRTKALSGAPTSKLAAETGRGWSRAPQVLTTLWRVVPSM
jgi:hypothetical protein